jgi:hypothetical protein
MSRLRDDMPGRRHGDALEETAAGVIYRTIHGRI